MLLLNSFKLFKWGLKVAAFGIILLFGIFALGRPMLLLILLLLLIIPEDIFLILILFPNEFILGALLSPILLILFDIERFIWLFIIGPLIPPLKGFILFIFKLLFPEFSGGNFLITVLLPLSFILFVFWFCCFNTCSKFIVFENGLDLLNLEKFFVIDNSWNLPSSSSSSGFGIEKGIKFELELSLRWDKYPIVLFPLDNP